MVFCIDVTQLTNHVFRSVGAGGVFVPVVRVGRINPVISGWRTEGEGVNRIGSVGTVIDPVALGRLAVVVNARSTAGFRFRFQRTVRCTVPDGP